jgi:ABC-2 type transport system ATP-binding protein
MQQVASVRLSSLTKRYGKHRGIEEVTLEAVPGQVLGFLGPNGAGKTTALRTLLGFLHPTSGSAAVLGLDVATQSVEVRRHVGYLPGDPALYGGRTGWDLMRLALAARGVAVAPLAEEVVAALDAPMERDVKKCSRGMRQKIALVLALAHDPDIIILDEPTAGLDPLGQRALLRLIDERAKAGRTVVLSSHILSEVEQVCDRVAILRDGRLAAVSTVEELRAQKYREVTMAFVGEAPAFEGLGEVEVVWRHENRMTLRVRAEASTLLRALAALDLTDVTITEPTLEEVFLDYYRDGGAA